MLLPYTNVLSKKYIIYDNSSTFTYEYDAKDRVNKKHNTAKKKVTE